MNAIDRFMDKVATEPNTGCWLWLGHRIKGGYGQFYFQARMVSAHRWYYQQIYGSVPRELDLDHRCAVTSCVNPQHLRPATRRDNIFASHSKSAPKLRSLKTHCSNGHEYSVDNVRILQTKYGTTRQCRICRRGRVNAYNHKIRGNSKRFKLRA